jgi:hypothetical protein
VAI